ncbi:MAG TPA: hypothetical protein GXX19_13605 [Syntrophomonadaceae bacterium]|nr:hypothetical protein [Syntrophomonadaceae bacterium]
MLETTINAQAANYLSEQSLAKLIKERKFDKKYSVQIFNLYTDVSLQDIVTFITEYGISDADFFAYYKLFVKKYYPNPELEEIFGHVG